MLTAGETRSAGRDFVELDEISVDCLDHTVWCVNDRVHVICMVGTPTDLFLCLMNYLTFSSYTQKRWQINLPSTVESV